MQYFGTGRLGTTQNVAYTGTAGTIATGATTGVQKVRVMVTTDAFIAISKSTAATTSDAYLPAFILEYFTINPGEKVSAIQSAANGTLYVTEIV